MYKDIFAKIQDEFFRLLNSKNSWGKEEVKNLYRTALNNILAETIDKMIEDAKEFIR